MIDWFNSSLCKNRVACNSCRNKQAFRASLLKSKLVTELDFACPHGITPETIPTPINLPEQPVVPKTTIIYNPVTREQKTIVSTGKCCGKS